MPYAKAVQLQVFMLLLLHCSFLPAASVPVWTWVKGTAVDNYAPVYRTQGVANAASTPGGREGAACCLDSAGRMWLFGGSLHSYYVQNDLWCYDPTIDSWSWIKGGDAAVPAGVYGTKGVAAAGNVPGGRENAVLWIDGAGKLWLFGGFGYGVYNTSNTPYGKLNDLWRFDPATRQWTWVKGSSTIDALGVYGTRGTASPNNTPGGRVYASSWTDNNGRLWLFGGRGCDAFSASDYYLNDLWRFDPATTNWTWIKGSNDGANAPAIYGTQSQTAADNTPGPRSQAAACKDQTGQLWLFGGEGFDANQYMYNLNDLWRLDPQTGNWTWVKGYAKVPYGGAPAVYGTRQVPAPANDPGGRMSSTAWGDRSGRLWVFGGALDHQTVLNDMWCFDPATGYWTWFTGNNTPNQKGTYGTRGLAAPANTPGGRQSACSWTDRAGQLWLYSGHGYDAMGSLDRPCDLWRFDPASGNWTWVKGSGQVGQHGYYGAQGVETASNKPGARTNASSWIDSSGQLWLFGGDGYASTGSGGYLNDLWRYNPKTNCWTWVKGSPEASQTGTYGMQGAGAPANTPGARHRAASWIDRQGRLWLFGGWGWDGSSDYSYFNDLWRFDSSSSTWTWVKGSNTAGASGIYGTQGAADAGNTPGARFDSVSWTDRSGRFWLFGGTGYDASGQWGELNDLWRFDPAMVKWTWLKGSKTVRANGIYGTRGVANPANTPGARSGAVGWRDGADRLWLFGGFGLDADPVLPNPGYGYFVYPLNDLWCFDPATGNWTWVKGSNDNNQSGIYGAQNIPAPANTPGARSGAVTWIDAVGQLWLFGGNGYDSSANGGALNDLWRFDPKTGNWTWVKGSNQASQFGIPGVQGRPAPATLPGGRSDAVAWFDQSGQGWMFGGTGYNDQSPCGYLGDLWRLSFFSGVEGDSWAQMN